jgi:WD40 repeat protein
MAPPILPTILQHTLHTHTAPINALTFSSLGGTYILTGSSDRQIHLSRSAPTTSITPQVTTTPIQKYVAHGYPILDIAVSADNQTFASVGGDRAVFLWDVQNNEGTVRRFGSNTNQAHTQRITCVCFAGQDDGVLASGSDDTSIRLWDVKSRDGRPIMVWEEAKDGISCIAIPENTGWEVIAGSTDGRVRGYDLRMGRVVVDMMPGSVTSLEVSRDAKIMLVGCLDGKVRVMDRGDGTCLRSLPGEEGNGYKNEGLRLKSCFGMNEGLVLSGSEADGCVRAWDVLSGKQMGRIPLNDDGKVVSVVKWREGSVAQGRTHLWAGGGADGIVKIYGE